MSGLAVLLKRRGYDVKIIYYADEHFYASYLTENGVSFEYLPDLLYKYLRPIRLRRYIRGYNPDIVVSYLQSTNMAACLARLMGRFPLIVSERNTNSGVNWKDRALFNLYRLADVVVPNSYSQAKFIKAHFPFLVGKTVVITNFVNTDYFKPLDRKEENTLLKILVVARVVPQKNCHVFLDALKLVKQRTDVRFRVDWFGNPQKEEYAEVLRRRVVEEGIGDLFAFHPASADILREYQRADIFCLPSLYEGFPNTVCEAMSCALPILCSRVCDNPDIVEDGRNGFLFDPLSAEDMAEKILEMLAMPSRGRADFAEASRLRAERLFSPDSFVEKYIELL